MPPADFIQPARLTDYQAPDGYKLDPDATARALNVMRAEACPVCDDDHPADQPHVHDR